MMLDSAYFVELFKCALSILSRYFTDLLKMRLKTFDTVKIIFG